MANVAVTSDAWTEISITSGTVQNISATADIELSAEQTDNSGVVLKPSELYQWDNETIYARAVTEDTGALRVVNFKRATGGGGYVLPVASSSALGGVKVGGGLDIDASGVLSAPVNYSTTEQQIGTWIDGKPLYQITVDCGALPNSSVKTIVTGLFFIDTIADMKGVCYSSSGFWRDLPKVQDDSSTVNAVSQVSVDGNNNNNLIVQILSRTADNSSFEKSYMTIQYTKTTD